MVDDDNGSHYHLRRSSAPQFATESSTRWMAWSPPERNSRWRALAAETPVVERNMNATCLSTLSDLVIA
jgi:hypothetical protein